MKGNIFLQYFRYVKINSFLNAVVQSKNTNYRK